MASVLDRTRSPDSKSKLFRLEPHSIKNLELFSCEKTAPKKQKSFSSSTLSLMLPKLCNSSSLLKLPAF